MLKNNSYPSVSYLEEPQPCLDWTLLNKLSHCLQPSNKYYWRNIIQQGWLVLIYDVRSHRSTQHWLEKLVTWINHSHLHFSPTKHSHAFPDLSPFSAGDLASYLRTQKTSIGKDGFNFRWLNLQSFSLASFLFQWKSWPSIRVNSTTSTLDLRLLSQEFYSFSHLLWHFWIKKKKIGILFFVTFIQYK